MEHREGTFTGCRNCVLYYQCWLPASLPKAILLLAHGLAEHGGRYANLADHFVSEGFGVYALDHRGHGQSQGLQGYVERFSDYLNDLDSFLNLARHEHGGIKIFLVGHSVGGTIAIAYAADYQNDLAGLVLSGVYLKDRSNVNPVYSQIARMASAVLPKIGVSTIDASAISRDKEVVTAYLNDPLVYKGKISARLGIELLDTMKRLPLVFPKINLPVLVMHGNADRIADPAASQRLFELLGSQNKTLKLYEGFHHEIFNEPGHEQVLADMETWLNDRLLQASHNP